MNAMLRTFGPLLLVALALAFALAPIWLAPGLADSYDWWLHLKWQQAFREALAEGRLWPSWIGTAHGGWGAPVFVYYPPFAYYLFAGIAAVGVDAVALVKLYLSMCMLLLASATYVALRGRCGGPIAALASAMTVSSPSVLFMVERLNMYPSLLATAALPLLFAAAAGLMRTPAWTMSTAGLATAAMAWTHVPTLVMGLSAAAVVAGLRLIRSARDERRGVGVFAFGVMLGLGSAAALLLPAWAGRDLIHHDAALRGVWEWRTNFLFDPGVAMQGFRSNYRFQGIAVAWSVVASALAIALTRYAPGPFAKIARRLGMAAIACGLMTSPLATPLYAAAPVFELLQFPWRWQAPTAVLAVMAVALAMAGTRISVPASSALSVLAVAAAVLAVDLHATRRWIDEAPRTSDHDLRWALAGFTADPPEYRTRAMGEAWRRDLHADRGATLRPSDAGAVTEVAATHHQRVWRLTTDVQQSVRFRTLCFPGWQLWIDGVQVPAHCSDDGAIEARVPRLVNAHLVLRYTRPPLRMLGNLVSAASLLILLWLMVWFAGWRSLGRAT